MVSNVNKREGTTKADELRAWMLKSQAETIKATGSQIHNSIRVLQNPNENSDGPRVSETASNTINDPVQPYGGPVGMSNYDELSITNLNANATRLGESLTMNPSNVVESDVVDDVFSGNPSVGETTLFRDGVRVSNQAGRFVPILSSMDGGSSLAIYLDTRVVNRKRKNKGSSAGNKLLKGVPVSKGFQVEKKFAFQPKASNVGFNGNTSTPGVTNPKVGPSKNMNGDASFNTKGTNTRQQDTGKKISNIASHNLFVTLGVDDDEEEEACGIDEELDHGFFWVILTLLLILKIIQLNQKSNGSNGILKKIDRIMGNLQFNDTFPGSFAIFQPYRISDHSMYVLRIPTVTKPKPKPFKFSNFLMYKEGFCEIMETGWSVNLEGCAMFCVVKRLKGLKSPFQKLLHNHGNLHERVNKIQIELDEAQKAIDRDPSSSILHEEHAHYLLAFKEAQLDEERFLKQKSKIKWLKAGDSTIAYFHKIVKSRCARNKIEMASDASNDIYDGNQVPSAFGYRVSLVNVLPKNIKVQKV
nr:RNA-directed DNA polymerase, eukaryota, reverse transcriptase zinc-binding domain protein [Tanacetum cinerariifolium]